MSFWYGWLIALWVFQSIGFVRAYIQHPDGEPLAARNLALLLHVITLVAILNVR